MNQLTQPPNPDSLQALGYYGKVILDVFWGIVAFVVVVSAITLAEKMLQLQKPTDSQRPTSHVAPQAVPKPVPYQTGTEPPSVACAT